MIHQMGNKVGVLINWWID